MTDQECEVELLQYLCWDDCWVSWLGFGVVWEWWTGTISMSIGDPVGCSVGVMTVAIDTVGSFCLGSDTAFWNPSQRWSDGGVFGIWRGEVVSDVFDKETFSLL